MAPETDETTDVAQLVLRTEELEGDGYRYFLARRTKDGFWEWIGGKRERGETVEEAAVRELNEEIKVRWEQEDFEIVRIAEEYESRDNPDYRLHPVLIEVERTDFSEEDLSDEHDRLAWIELDEFDEYETLGQLKALKRLDIIQGDVAVGIVESEGMFLVVRRSEAETMSGKWEFPGGIRETGESLEEAILREVREETGLEPELIEQQKHYIGKGSTGYWLLHPFHLRAEKKTAELSGEHDDFQWVQISDLESMKTVGQLKAVQKLGLSQ